MHFPYAVTVPAGTTEADPYTGILELTAGRITAVQVVIPAGHKGKAHLLLLYHEFQLYPLSRGETYHGDKTTISFADDFDLTSGPYELKAVGWNEDADYDHEFLVGIEVTTESETASETTVSLEDLQALIGSTSEE